MERACKAFGSGGAQLVGTRAEPRRSAPPSTHGEPPLARTLHPGRPAIPCRPRSPCPSGRSQLSSWVMRHGPRTWGPGPAQDPRRGQLSAAHGRPRRSSTPTASDCAKEGLQKGRVLVLRRRPRVSSRSCHGRGRGEARVQGFGATRHSNRARGVAQRTAIDAGASSPPSHSPSEGTCHPVPAPARPVPPAGASSAWVRRHGPGTWGPTAGPWDPRGPTARHTRPPSPVIRANRRKRLRTGGPSKRPRAPDLRPGRALMPRLPCKREGWTRARS